MWTINHTQSPFQLLLIFVYYAFDYLRVTQYKRALLRTEESRQLIMILTWRTLLMTTKGNLFHSWPIATSSWLNPKLHSINFSWVVTTLPTLVESISSGSSLPSWKTTLACAIRMSCPSNFYARQDIYGWRQSWSIRGVIINNFSWT